MNIKHLGLESLQIQSEEAEILAKFFQRSDCHVEELELHETDLDHHALKTITDAFI